MRCLVAAVILLALLATSSFSGDYVLTHLEMGVSDINNNGQIIGTHAVSGLVYGYIWQDGNTTDLGVLLHGGYPRSPATVSINDLGEVVGWRDDGAFFWKDGSFTMIDAPGEKSTPVCINNHSYVLGRKDNSYETYIWHDGVKTLIPELSIKGTYVVGIDDNLRIAAYGKALPFVWSQGAVTNLPVFGSTIGCTLYRMNDAGSIVGSLYDGTSSIGVMWENGVLRQPPVPLDALDCINDKGDVVAGDLLWRGDELIHLNEVTEMEAESRINRGLDINNDGEILVQYSDINYIGHYGLLTPIDTVRIDVVPGSSVNRIDVRTGRCVSVALFGSRAVSIEDVLLGTIRMAGAAPVRAKKVHLDRDRIADLLLEFRVDDLKDLKAEDFEVTLTGRTRQRHMVRGNDSIEVHGLPYNDIPSKLRYTLKVLETEPHNDIWPTDINDSGQVVGVGCYYDNWRVPELTPVPFSGWSINREGWVAGQQPTSNATSSPVLWRKDAGLYYLKPLPGYANGSAWAINDSGLILGDSYNDYRNSRVGCVWQAGGDPVPVPLPVPAGWSTASAAIVNNRGQMIGSVNGNKGPRICSWQIGDNFETPTILGIGWSPHALNDNGQIVGSEDTLSTSRAVRWTGTKTEEIPLPDHYGSSASDVNDIGRIVGRISFGRHGMDRPFVYDDEHGCSLLPVPNDTPYVRASVINDVNVICGDYGVAGVGRYPVVWYPTLPTLLAFRVTPSTIGMKSRGIISVLICSRDGFDPKMLNPPTLSLAGARPADWQWIPSGRDTRDLLVQFRVQEMSLTPGRCEVTLRGLTKDDAEVTGKAAVNVRKSCYLTPATGWQLITRSGTVFRSLEDVRVSSSR